MRETYKKPFAAIISFHLFSMLTTGHGQSQHITSLNKVIVFIKIGNRLFKRGQLDFYQSQKVVLVLYSSQHSPIMCVWSIMNGGVLVSPSTCEPSAAVMEHSTSSVRLVGFPQKTQHPHVQLFNAPICVWQAVRHILVPHATRLSDSEWDVFVNLTRAPGRSLCVAHQSSKHRGSKATRHTDSHSYWSTLET